MTVYVIGGEPDLLSCDFSDHSDQADRRFDKRAPQAASL